MLNFIPIQPVVKSLRAIFPSDFIKEAAHLKDILQGVLTQINQPKSPSSPYISTDLHPDPSHTSTFDFSYDVDEDLPPAQPKATSVSIIDDDAIKHLVSFSELSKEQLTQLILILNKITIDESLSFAEFELLYLSKLKIMQDFYRKFSRNISAVTIHTLDDSKKRHAHITAFYNAHTKQLASTKLSEAKRADVSASNGTDGQQELSQSSPSVAGSSPSVSHSTLSVSTSSVASSSASSPALSTSGLSATRRTRTSDSDHEEDNGSDDGFVTVFESKNEDQTGFGTPRRADKPKREEEINPKVITDAEFNLIMQRYIGTRSDLRRMLFSSNQSTLLYLQLQRDSIIVALVHKKLEKKEGETVSKKELTVHSQSVTEIQIAAKRYELVHEYLSTPSNLKRHMGMVLTELGFVPEQQLIAKPAASAATTSAPARLTD